MPSPPQVSEVELRSENASAGLGVNETHVEVPADQNRPRVFVERSATLPRTDFGEDSAGAPGDAPPPLEEVWLEEVIPWDGGRQAYGLAQISSGRYVAIGGPSDQIEHLFGDVRQAHTAMGVVVRDVITNYNDLALAESPELRQLQQPPPADSDDYRVGCTLPLLAISDSAHGTKTARNKLMSGSGFVELLSIYHPQIMNVDSCNMSTALRDPAADEDDSGGTIIAQEIDQQTMSGGQALATTPPRTRRPLPKDTEETDQRDYFDDVVLYGSRPTKFVEISAETSVDEFLLALVPTSTLSKRPNVVQLLSKLEPTAWPVHTAALLHKDDIQELENLKYDAWREDGVRSIQSPSRAGVRWPLWVLDFWRSQARVRDSQRVWKDAIAYLQEELRRFDRKVVWHSARVGEAVEVEMYKARVATFNSTLARVHNLSWSAVVSTESGSLDTLQLAKLLGENWTSGDVLDSAIILLK
ncbi:hypothetical protein P7C70_g7946, partial [Phenoliferia sp. Uapishka_3]